MGEATQATDETAGAIAEETSREATCVPLRYSIYFQRLPFTQGDLARFSDRS